jgi:hypothetical protein
VSFPADAKHSLCDPDKYYAEGVSRWHDDGAMDDLMLFLITYVQTIHANWYFKNVLSMNPGASYLDIITPSDVAYACSLIKNSSHEWTAKMSNNGVVEKGTKPHFTSGQGAKRTFGMTTWNSNGIKYFEKAKDNWIGAYTKADPQYKTLCNYWDNWIKAKGKEIKVVSKDGSLKSNSIYSISREREEGEVVAGGAAEHESNEEDKFAYDSDLYDETVDIGNWNNKRGSLQRRDNEVEEEEVVQEEEEEEDGGDGDGDNNSYSSDDGDGERRINGLQQENEREAEVRGMTRRSETTKQARVVNNRKRNLNGMMDQGRKRVATRPNGK